MLEKLIGENNPLTAALLIVEQLQSGKLTKAELKTKIFGDHWRNECWQEVLRLIAGGLDEDSVSDVIEYLILQNGQEEKFINLFLAAQCLRETRNRDRVTVDTKLLNCFKSLCQYGTGFLILYQSAQELQETYQVRSQAIRAIAATWKHQPETLTWLLNLAESTDTGEIRATAVQELARGWPDAGNIYILLKTLAQSDG
ncbi:MAG TPA: HEAT repeat domain-containing protein, partial [Kamptonema sp.]|nr:HEAT repeat domain-containing protein [Kamptonema sp.]